MATTTDPAPNLETTLGADTDKTGDSGKPAMGMPVRTIALGTLGTVLILLTAVGAAGILVRDPVLGNGPLSWIRYGHGKMLATAVLYIGFALVVWAWVRLGRHVLAGRVDARAVLTAALCWMAPLVFSPPVFTRDVFSYLGQGTLPLHGFDPYAVGPAQLENIPDISQNVHSFWQTTPAPYGPMFILVAKGVVSITGSDAIMGVILMRLALAIGLGLLIWALPGLVKHLGGKLPVALWLAVASPMTVVHLFGGPHNDILMVGLLAAGTLCVLNRKHVLGIVLATLAMAVKASAAPALPFLVWVWAKHLTSTFWRNFVRAAALSIGIFAATFTAVTLAAGVNLGWFPALRAPAMIVNWMSPPTAVGEFLHWVTALLFNVSKDPFVMVTRAIGALLLVYIFVKQWWAARDGGADAVRRMAIVLLCVAVLSPATLPWYLTWGFVIAAALPWQVNRLPMVVGFAVFLVLTYSPAGEDQLYNYPFMAAAVLVSILAAKALTTIDPLNMFGHKRPALVDVGPAPTRAPTPTPGETKNPVVD
nr:polyprenol phosphomannose-dependent alpha 1,6 mannosyltransferase MptB [Kibdelosporangium sp. MJ126-NF4]CEL13733.1 possible membrane protein [Kibdelosporangium sp. MJ126-NF4]CTQ99420.1 possible membrane protein [Kibdelosporangium sp. MJ126-NF4]